jgi:hypothetical protein
VKLKRIRRLTRLHILICQYHPQRLQNRNRPTPIIIRPWRAVVELIRIPRVDTILVRPQYDCLVAQPRDPRNHTALQERVAERLDRGFHSARRGDHIFHGLEEPGRGLRAVGRVEVAVLKLRERLEIGAHGGGGEQGEQRGNGGLVRYGGGEGSGGDVLLDRRRIEVFGDVDEICSLLWRVSSVRCGTVGAKGLPQEARISALL